MSILSTMDIGYLPYWFDKEHEIVAATSFPGKMSAYAAAGLAVFHHAPSYTEPTAFLEQYPFGCSCASLDAREIEAALASLVELAATEGCHHARAEALEDELSKTAVATRFDRFIGCTAAA